MQGDVGQRVLGDPNPDPGTEAGRQAETGESVEEIATDDAVEATPAVEAPIVDGPLAAPAEEVAAPEAAASESTASEGTEPAAETTPERAPETTEEGA